MNNCQVITPINRGYGGLRFDLSAYRDSKLIDPMRGHYYPVNRPPLSGKMREEEIYSERPDWQNYKDYNDIERGQILYYYRGTSRVPYDKEIFDSGSYSMVKFVDPNCVSKFYFPYQDCPNLCNQSQNDEVYHREDIMSKQMSKFNKHKYVVLP